MNIWTKIGLIVIILHFFIGFGWLIYKLSPKKSDKNINNTDKNVK